MAKKLDDQICLKHFINAENNYKLCCAQSGISSSSKSKSCKHLPTNFKTTTFTAGDHKSDHIPTSAFVHDSERMGKWVCVSLTWSDPTCQVCHRTCAKDHRTTLPGSACCKISVVAVVVCLFKTKKMPENLCCGKSEIENFFWLKKKCILSNNNLIDYKIKCFWFKVGQFWFCIN